MAELDAELGLGDVGPPAFRALFEHSAEAMALIVDERIVACNGAAAALLGYRDRAALLGRRPEEISPPLQADGRPSAERAQALLAAAAEEGSQRFEWLHRRSDGSTLSVEVLLTALPLPGRALFHVAWHDISERVRARAARERLIAEYRHELARRRQITRAMHDILTLLASAQPLTAVLDYLAGHAARLLGADGAAIYQVDAGRQRLQLVARQGGGPSDEPAVLPVGAGITGGAVARRRPLFIGDAPEWLSAQRDGHSLQGSPAAARLSPRFASASALPLLIRGQLYGALTLYYAEARTFGPDEIQLSEACADYAALAIEQTTLRVRAEQAATAAERSRLARDLHDAVSQTLFSASLIADVVPQLWARDPTLGARRLEEVRQLTRSALAEMRALLLELRPDALVEMPFAALLGQLAEAVGGRAGVRVELQVDPPDGGLRLAPDLQVALYRIAQEALNNAARHGRAAQITLACRLTLAAQRALGEGASAPVVAGVTLCVRDDGAGFDPARVGPGHLGLRTMRERAEAVGAKLELASAPGAGTSLTVSWAAPAG